MAPLMRFLNYATPGGYLPAHVDLPRTVDGRKTTHTFLLYLTECEEGGETLLLSSLVGDARLAPLGGVEHGERAVLAKCAPVAGRLLVMPHACPHSSAVVVDAPKLLVRGEVTLPEWPAKRASR